MSNVQKKFRLFLLFNLVIWSLVPLLRKSIPMDAQEAIIWGKYCLWGTTKHPPFSGWVAYSFYNLFGEVDKIVYFLSQIFVALGIYYIYKLARCFLDENKALLAALLQFGVIYYNFSSVEFNVNVISLALWPMCAYYFWLSYQNNKLKDWILFGILAGINLLNKYIAGFMLLSIFVFVLCDKKGRSLFLNYKSYISVFICLSMLVPHIWWLYENDFEMLNYILFRNKEGNIVTYWRHLIYPLKFLGAQVLFSAVALITFGGFYLCSEKEITEKNISKSRFLLLANLLPIGIFILISLIRGTPLKSMWGFPCLYLLGISLFYFFPFKLSEKKINKFFVVMIIWSLLFVMGYGIQCLLTRSERFHTDCNQFVEIMTEKWNEQNNGKKLEYLGSDAWYANMFALYSENEVKPMLWMKPKNNPWFDENDFYIKGAMIITSNEPEYNMYKEMYGEKMTPYQIMEVEFKNYFGRSKVRKIFYGFYQGEGTVNEK